MDIDNSPVARVSNEFLNYQYDVLGILDYMSSPDGLPGNQGRLAVR